MTRYAETQVNRLWLAITILIFGPVIVGVVGLVVVNPDVPAGLLVATIGPVIGTVALVGGSRLDVEVDESKVELRWRFGWPAKTIQRSEIVGVESLQIPWWYGWGIRKVPRGWMWNVKGRGAVALQLSDDRRFLIGTGDAVALEAALRT